MLRETHTDTHSDTEESQSVDGKGRCGNLSIDPCTFWPCLVVVVVVWYLLSCTRLDSDAGDMYSREECGVQSLFSLSLSLALSILSAVCFQLQQGKEEVRRLGGGVVCTHWERLAAREFNLFSLSFSLSAVYFFTHTTKTWGPPKNKKINFATLTHALGGCQRSREVGGWEKQIAIFFFYYYFYPAHFCFMLCFALLCCV